MSPPDAPKSIRYRLLSEHFQACVELPEAEREEYLSGSNVDSPTLRDELRSLLAHHPRTSPAAKPAPARTAKRRGFARTAAAILAAAAAGAALLLALRSWTLDRLEAPLRVEGLAKLQRLLDLRVAELQAWRGRVRTAARAVLEDPAFVSRVAELADAAAGAEPEVRGLPAYASLRRSLSTLPPGLADVGFRVVSPSGVTLCSGGAAETVPGSPPFPPGLSLQACAVSRPARDRRLGWALAPDVERPLLYAGGPIRGDRDRILAVGLFFFSPDAELARLLAPEGPARLLLFDEGGLLLNDLPDGELLTRAGVLPATSDGRTALRARLRDPGEDLSTGRSSRTPPGEWPPTRMCRSDGPGAGEYRDLLGRRVLGTWTWLPEPGMGVGAEADVAAILAPSAPVRAAFAGVLALFGLCGAGVLFAAARAARSGVRAAGYGYYAVEGPLGAGGMGDVYLARHSVLHRPAALKVLRASGSDGPAAARFKREARLACRLAHPNAVQIYDYGEGADGRLYYAMEYVAGLNVAQLVVLDGPLPVARCVYLLRQVAGALEEAHALGLLHRDLKPTNLMVGTRGGLGDVVKVLDFGIASSVSGVEDDATRTIELAGTPAYIAPERIRHPHRLDFRSDIYSFGGVAFHMLTGRSVFEGPGPAELIYQVLTSDRPSPSRLRGERVSEPLERLVLDCLAVDPDARPASMRDVTLRLKAAETADAWSQDEARAWWTSNAERVARLKAAST